jgi:alpha-methylacyl-CoA racemase
MTGPRTGRPGVAERLGLGPEAVWLHNPRVVYGRMTGWGQTGPLAASAGHDIGYIAVTGALHAVGAAGGPPQIPVNLIGAPGVVRWSTPPSSTARRTCWR